MTAPNLYDVGDVVRLRGSFTNSAGLPVDPSSVTVQVRRSLDSQNSYQNFVYGVDQVSRVSTGEYYYDFSVVSEGEHRYRWNGLGANAAGGEKIFMIRTRWVGS